MVMSQSILDAAGGSRRDLLVALRDQIASQIDEGVPARDLASLSLRLLDITEQISALDDAEKSDVVSDAVATEDEPF